VSPTSIHYLGGRATKKAVLDIILEMDYLKLTPADFETMQNGFEQTWRNDFAFVRKYLVNGGYIDGTVKNSWAATAEG
jgi:hypothetical protein